jgi:three-Cys-motif partner protein
MSKRVGVTWDADPHTIAKIAILKNYLHAWFRILGKTRKGQTLLYVDGFAGPGYYKNHPEGSPLAALQTASDAVSDLGTGMLAHSLHCAFIEKVKARYDEMSEAVEPFIGRPKMGLTRVHGEFVNGIEEVRRVVPGPFRGDGPLFVFADPFGGTGIPFATFASCMKSDTAELLINLDADGICRIFAAESNNGRDAQLTELFGNECWREKLTERADMKKLSVQILNLYKERLRSLPGVKFIWSFAMRGKADSLNYHLVFASKHPLGLTKMKEAMRKIDKSGSYSFSDAHVDQHALFQADDAQVFAEEMFGRYDGKTMSMDDLTLYALNETPFINAKEMLAVLDTDSRIQIECHPGQTRRSGTYPEEKIRLIRFGRFAVTQAQGELF